MVKIRREAFFHDVKVRMNQQWFEAATKLILNFETMISIQHQIESNFNSATNEII